MLPNINKIYRKTGGFLILLSLLTAFSLPQPSIHAQGDVLTTRIQRQKAEVETQLDSLNQSLRERSTALLDISSRKNTLQAEITAREESIRVLNENITSAKLAEAQIQEQINVNEEKREEILDQMEELIPLIQIESKKTDLQVIIESKNLGQLMRRLYGLSTIQVEFDRLDNELESVNKSLDESRIQQQLARETLENTRFLEKSEQDGLKLLLDQTQGEESQYQQLISDLRSQKQEQEAQIALLDQQFQAALEERRAEEERQRILAENTRNQNIQNGNSANTPRTESGQTPTNNTGGTVTISPVPPTTPAPTGSCRFEDGRSLPVRLTRPTSGFISDDFGCPSVTGRWHDGYDIANGLGTPIVAAYGGTVERKGFEFGGFGHFIMLRHSASGTTFFTLYAHMQSESTVPIGTVVGQGAQIGLMGSTGWSTGPHLHFMIYSDSYLQTGSLGCTYGSTKCFNPGKFTNF